MPSDRLSLEDYFGLEGRSPEKHEFDDGRILVMAGGSPLHNYLCARIAHLLNVALESGPCFALSGDQRIGTADGLYTYADASVFCGEMTLGREQTATNPVAVFEVLSDSTRDYDRGEKLERYKTIPSLRHVVLVDQLVIDIEVWTRGPTSWTRRVHTDPADVLTLESPRAELRVAELYAGSERLPA